MRYEVAVCIATGHIVWINGPYPCGKNPDITIFHKGLKGALNWGERVDEADKGYRGEPYFISVPQDYRSDEQKIAKNDARSHQEHINQRFKMLHQCLHQTFRHDVRKHTNVFWACAVVVQVGLQFEEKLIWQVNYVGEQTTDNIFLREDNYYLNTVN